MKSRVNKIVTQRNALTVKLELLLIPEGDLFIAYCPALDLSSYGSTMDEAQSAFDEALELFLEDTEERGTLALVLLQLGWTLSKNDYQPPRTNLSRIMKLDPQKVVSERVKLPALA